MPDDVDPPASGARPEPGPATAGTLGAGTLAAGTRAAGTRADGNRADGHPAPSTLEEIPPAERTPVAGVQEALRRRWARPGGRLYAGLRWGGATVFAAVAVALVVSLLASSSQAFAHSGLSFLWSGT